jgi:DNA-binding MarR family transcriptional regulator
VKQTGRSSTGPTRAELTVWRDFLRAHAAVTRALEEELADERDLPLTWYDVLVQLVEAPGHRLRMTELASRVLTSRSGLTRLVDRMVSAGLVERQPCPDDARGTFTALTGAGFARLRDAAPVHLRGVQAHMMSMVRAEELAVLGAVMRRVADAHRMPAGPDYVERDRMRAATPPPPDRAIS